ncbi:hypothetical protein LTR84_007952 [Exophiala bonariae]|uniref:Uncharacterized protein n=1 Tax=Exophiala bonariae TaxID=1690606 RepID=A0AAV9NQM0_9EURO|nr:hypothetical protein LTR84_007952 [Exophiala bonariae]
MAPRRRDDSEEPQPLPPNKRRRTDGNPSDQDEGATAPATRDLRHTNQVHSEMTAQYGGEDLPLPQFVGLCGYLCTILRWGYHVHTVDLDAFVQLHSSFVGKLPDFEREQSDVSNPLIPSYHEWYLEQPSEVRELYTSSILTEARLRDIWRENHYEFLKVELSLIKIGKDRKAHHEFLLRHGGTQHNGSVPPGDGPLGERQAFLPPSEEQDGTSEPDHGDRMDQVQRDTL